MGVGNKYNKRCTSLKLSIEEVTQISEYKNEIFRRKNRIKKIKPYSKLATRQKYSRRM